MGEECRGCAGDSGGDPRGTWLHFEGLQESFPISNADGTVHGIVRSIRVADLPSGVAFSFGALPSKFLVSLGRFFFSLPPPALSNGDSCQILVCVNHSSFAFLHPPDSAWVF